jgi:predicted dehydrogenase
MLSNEYFTIFKSLDIISLISDKDLLKHINLVCIIIKENIMIKVGVLGTGFGKFHAELYNKLEGFELVSIYGRDINKLKQIGAELNIHTTQNIYDIVQNPEIDLLDICLPTELHSKWAIEGLKNNKHIFCETPISYSLDEAIEIKKYSKKYKKNVFVNLFIKFSTPHLTAVKYTKEGKMGMLTNMHAYNSTSSRWGDLGVRKSVETFHNHLIDFVCEIAGMPGSVSSFGTEFEGKSIVTSIFKTENIYITAQSNSSLPESCPFSIGFELIFTNGLIRFDAIYGEYTKEEFIVFQNGKKAEIVQLDMKDDYEETFNHVLECINNNQRSPLIDIDFAINQIKVKDMIFCSIGDQ